jgi:hypothetical protein
MRVRTAGRQVWARFPALASVPEFAGGLRLEGLHLATPKERAVETRSLRLTPGPGDFAASE